VGAELGRAAVGDAVEFSTLKRSNLQTDKAKQELRDKFCGWVTRSLNAALLVGMLQGLHTSLKVLEFFFSKLKALKLT